MMGHNDVLGQAKKAAMGYPENLSSPQSHKARIEEDSPGGHAADAVVADLLRVSPFLFVIRALLTV